MRRDVWPALGLLFGGWLLTLSVMPWSDERINDLGVYRRFSEQMLDGNLPYRDFLFEYPPLSVPVVGLPGVVGTGYDPFRIAFAVEMLIAAVAVLLLVAAIAERSEGDRRRALYAAALLPLLCGASARTHFDLVAAAGVLAAVLLLLTGRSRSGLATIGAGALLKGFPLALAPVALGWLVGRGRTREAWQGALACAAVVICVSALVLALSPDGALDTVRYHLDRPVQVESTPAVGLLGLDALGLGDSDVRSSFGSEGVHHPAADLLEAVGLAFMVAALGLFTVGAAGTSAGPPGRRLVLASLGGVVAFAAFGKVLSPQFLLWIYPFGALAFAWRMHALAAAIGLAVLLTFVEFPAHYLDYVRGEWLVVLLVALRDVALVAAVGLALRELWLSREEDLLDRGRPAVVADVD